MHDTVRMDLARSLYGRAVGYVVAQLNALAPSPPPGRSGEGGETGGQSLSWTEHTACLNHSNLSQPGP